MGHLAAIVIGAVTVFLIVPPILYEFRGNVVHGYRQLLSDTMVKGNGRSGEVSYRPRSKGISIRAVGLAVGAAALIALVGILLDSITFILVGILISSNVLFAFIMSRVVAARNQPV